MSLNVYVGCTIILFIAASGMMLGIFAARKRKSKLWLVPIFSLSMTVFVSIFMYFLFAKINLVVSPWVAILFVFAEIGALMGCYINENMEQRSNLVRALVIFLSVIMFVALIITLMLTVFEQIMAQV